MKRALAAVGLIVLAMLAWGCLTVDVKPPGPPTTTTTLPAPPVTLPEAECSAMTRHACDVDPGMCDNPQERCVIVYPAECPDTAVPRCVPSEHEPREPISALCVGGAKWGCWDKRPDEHEYAWVPDKPDAGQPGELPICVEGIPGVSPGVNVNCWVLTNREWWVNHPASQPPVTSPPSTQPPAQPPTTEKKDCDVEMPDHPVRVDRADPDAIGPRIGRPGRQMAKSACLDYTAEIAPGVGGLRGNGTCFARNMAEGTDPKLLAELEQHKCNWPGGMNECGLYDPEHRIIGNPADYVVLKGGMLGHPNFFGNDRDGEMLRKAGAVDFYGRRAKTDDGGRTWYLVAHTGPNGELLADPAHSWTYHTLVPPLVARACPAEPAPASCRDVGCPPHSGCTEVTPGEWSCVSWDQPEPAEGCGVGYVGTEWSQINQKDRCPVPDAANADLLIAAGKSCVFRLEASSKTRPGGEHVGDKPGCFLAARPRWYQGDCVQGAGGNCVDLGGRDPNQDPDHYGQWDPVGDDGPAWGVHFEINFRTNLWIQACWPDNEAPGHVCSKAVRVIHQ